MKCVNDFSLFSKSAKKRTPVSLFDFLMNSIETRYLFETKEILTNWQTKNHEFH